MKMLWLVFLLLWSSSALAEKDPAAEGERPRTPGLQIALQRSTIRENDQIPVHIVVSNPSDTPLTDVSLSWTIPSGFLRLTPVPCESLGKHPARVSSQEAASTFPMRPLPGNADSQSIQAYDFCLVSTTAGEDTFDLFFALHYTWNDKAGAHHALLTQEKSIRSAFLGSDTLAGVPLGLASFVIPGLLFWMILDAWGTPWRVAGNALGDKMIYSVLVSLLLVAALKPWPLLRPYLDLTSGLSMSKLVLLACVGGACGLVAGGLDRLLRSFLNERAPKPDDTDLVLFAKLLRINRGKLRLSTVLPVKEGTRYRGSVGAQTATHVFLMGWYQIRSAAEGPLKEKLQDLIERGLYRKALKTALASGLEVSVRDFLYVKEGGAEESQETARYRVVEKREQMNGSISITESEAVRPLELC